jgi:UDP-N-acetylglucosamine--N-acetylmuramyl-(pentapeptide) pyrophosphoryl-undecaprenol N-acetylglucosamine transferase
MKLQQHNTRIIISGGGTGGHIFPAVAIGNALKKIDANIELLFVGAEGKMEMEKVPAAGFDIVGLPIAGIKRELSIDNLSFPIKLAKSLMKARKVIKDFKPDAVVGVGGYASGPLLFSASLLGVPTLIQEQNSYPGITNKILAKKAKRICVAYEGMEQFFEAHKIKLTGNPVRSDIKSIEGKKTEAAAYFGLDMNKPTILIVGGSQGARTINKAIANHLHLITAASIQVIWQTGKPFYAEAKQLAEQANVDTVKVHEFISRMDLAYAMCDIVLSRAGASTVSELAIVHKPAIMVPLPTAAEDHQTKNCLAMVNREAAILIKDIDAFEKLVPSAIDLINDKQQCEKLVHNITPMARPNADIDIAYEVLALVNN